MLGNEVEISLIYHRILGPLVLGWSSNPFVLGAQLAPCEKRLVCIPAFPSSSECSYKIFWSDLGLSFLKRLSAVHTSHEQMIPDRIAQSVRSGNRLESDCRFWSRKFDPGPVPYFHGD